MTMAPEDMALLGIVMIPVSVRIRVTRAVSSSTVLGTLLTTTESPTLSLWVAKTNAPARMPPTNVDTTKPMVMDANPAPVSSAWGETPTALSTANIIIRTAMTA